MEDFLQSTSDFSFQTLVDQDEDTGRFGQGREEAAEANLDGNLLVKKTKKDKKTKKGDGDLQPLTPTTTTKIEDDIATELAEKDWQTQFDPYMLQSEEAVDEDMADLPDLPMPTKRGMQRALRGFTRRSGGKKHKKKHAAAGKGPAKGRGKIAPLSGSGERVALAHFQSQSKNVSFVEFNFILCRQFLQGCSSLFCVSVASAEPWPRDHLTEDTVRPVKVTHAATKGLQSRRTLRGHQRWASCLVPNLVQLLEAWWLPVTEEAAMEKLLNLPVIMKVVMNLDAAEAVTVHIVVATGTKPCLQRIAEVKRRRRRRRRSDPVQHRRLRHLRLPSPAAAPQAARKRSRRSRRRRVRPWLWRLRPPPRSPLGCKAGWMGLPARRLCSAVR